MGERGEVLYVGKAKVLRNRVLSYTRITQLLPRTKKMVHLAKELKFQVLESELEALFTEAELIRTYQPEFNVLLKDDKSPLYIVITAEEFPRVLTVRRKELPVMAKKGQVIGPFQSAWRTKEVLKIVRPIFPWCNAPRPFNRPCFYSYLDLCPGVCQGHGSAVEYKATIANLVLFLRGKKKEVVRNLEAEMNEAKEQLHFERAAVLRDTISHINHVTSTTKVLKPDLQLPQLQVNLAEDRVIQLRKVIADALFLPKNISLHQIEVYDVSNISGTSAAVALVAAIDGEVRPDHYKLFNIRSVEGSNDYAMHQEALERRQNHPEWGMPNLIVIDGGKGQLSAALKVWHWSCPVVGLAKNPDRLVLVKPGTGGKREYTEIKLTPHNRGHQLLQMLRDEAHRFSKKQHHKRHARTLIPK
jgi:excinuclease UvrABC nuclease subunit